MIPLGIEYQTVLGYPPVDFVHLAADLGCQTISMKARGGGGPYNPWGFGTYSLIDDAPLRRRFVAALAERDVSISLGEGFVVLPGADLLADTSNLDLMEELGVRRVNAVTMDPDLDRSFDQIAAFVAVAAARGMEITMEFAKSLTVADLPTALSVVEHVGRPEFRLLIDTMHVVRSGVTADDLASIDPALIGYVQLCDALLEQQNEVYRDDSADRLVPGQGELPLLDLMLALPADLPIGIEVPMRSRAENGATPQECARAAVEGSQRLMAEVEVRRASRSAQT